MASSIIVIADNSKDVPRLVFRGKVDGKQSSDKMLVNGILKSCAASSTFPKITKINDETKR